MPEHHRAGTEHPSRECQAPTGTPAVKDEPETHNAHGGRGRADTLTPKAWARLQRVFLHDDPTDELSAAWAIKEQVRRLLKVITLEQANTERMRLGYYAEIAAMPETDRLRATIEAWWPQVETLITTGATNARTEAANTSIKQIKRTGRGYRNGQNYRDRILLASAAKTAA
jgi:transposase